MNAVAIVLFTLDTVFLQERLCVSDVYLGYGVPVWTLALTAWAGEVVGRPQGHVWLSLCLCVL